MRTFWPRTPDAADIEDLKDLLVRRDTLVNKRADMRTVFEATQGGNADAPFIDVLTQLDTSIKQDDRMIKELIDRTTPLKKRIKILSSMPGIGPVTAATCPLAIFLLHK